MSDHTPTPWRAHPSDNPEIWYLDRDPDDMGMIATVWGCDDRAEGNAKLIAKSVNEFAALEAENKKLRSQLGNAVSALRLLRGLIDEGGVPRYTVTPGATLNSVIEEDVDPILRQFPLPDDQSTPTQPSCQRT